jgi:hypothetical protein
MRTLRLFLILLVTAAGWAQTTKLPITLEVTPTSIMATNLSNQEIVAIVIRSPKGGSGWSGVISHDFYFRHGIAPTEAAVVDAQDDRRRYNSAEVLFVQFADGSTWGDSAVSSDFMARRGTEKHFLEGALSAYQNQGEQAFLDQLQQEKDLRGLAARLISVQKERGTTAVIDVIKERLEAAGTKPF